MQIDFNKYPYPKRKRHHTNPQLYIPADELKQLPENYPPLIKRLDWKQIFLNGKAPTHLDIGCGKGGFLLDFAELTPEANVLGIEVRKWPVDWINNFIGNEGINNCYALWYSVVNRIDFIESKTIDKVFYFFPDPWTKRKHLKRRAFNKIFLDDIARVLKPWGSLLVQTDVLEVHEHHVKMLKDHSAFIFDLEINDSDWELPKTNKEKFCIKENIPYYRIKAELK